MSHAVNPLSLERDGSPPGDDTGAAAPAAERPAATRPVDFAALYDQYYPRVFSYVMRTLMNRPAAEDVTSEAFFRALRQFATFDPRRAPFSAWIYRIATNAMRDHFRKNRKMVTLEAGDEALEGLLARQSEAVSAARQLEQAEAYTELHREIRQLKPLYRMAIVLFYFEGKNIQEIARIQGTFAPTVRWRLHRARRQLALQLNQARRDEQ
jgi:RNA polymerase sigma-70 factor (ECF subfamily)